MISAARWAGSSYSNRRGDQLDFDLILTVSKEFSERKSEEYKGNQQFVALEQSFALFLPPLQAPTKSTGPPSSAPRRVSASA
jgi:hypothetical protein